MKKRFCFFEIIYYSKLIIHTSKKDKPKIPHLYKHKFNKKLSINNQKVFNFVYFQRFVDRGAKVCIISI